MSIGSRYAAFTKRAAEMKRLRAPDVVAMKARHAASLRGPTLVKVYVPPSNPTRQVVPQKRGSEVTHWDSVDFHDDKRRKTSPTTFVRVSRDATKAWDVEMDRIADALAGMSVKSEIRAPAITRIISATFEFEPSASLKMVNAIANMSPMPNNKAKSRSHKFMRQSRALVSGWKLFSSHVCC